MCYAPRIIAQTRSRISLSLSRFNLPTGRRTQLSLAVTTRCGSAKLCRCNPPASKSLIITGTASGWPADWLVIWQRIRSPRVSPASTSAGLTLALARSVKGNGTTTTSPLTNRAMPHPLQVNPNPRPKPFAPAATNPQLLHSALCRVLLETPGIRTPRAGYSPAPS